MVEELKLIETPNNYNDKVEMIRKKLEDTKKKKKKHYKLFGKYKQINTFTKSLVNALNALSVCGMVLTFTPVHTGTMVMALSATSISGITSAISSSTDLEGKVHSHNTSYLQYNDLYRDISARLLRNGMSSSDLDNLLGEINSRIGLIEDVSLPITI